MAGVDAAVAQKVLFAVRRPVRAGEATLHPEASIGVAVVEAGEDEDAVMARADVALYEAKRAGRNRAQASATLHDRH